MNMRECLSQSRDDQAMHGVVSGYYDAFVNDPIAAAAYYGEPALIVLANEVLAFPTRKEVVAFLTRGRSDLRARGYLTTKMSESRIKRLSESTALYGTIAIRMKTDGTELERVASTYLLHKGSAGWKIHELVATDVDKLIS